MSYRLQVIVEGGFHEVAVEKCIAAADEFAHVLLTEGIACHYGALFGEEAGRDARTVSGLNADLQPFGIVIRPGFIEEAAPAEGVVIIQMSPPPTESMGRRAL